MKKIEHKNIQLVYENLTVYNTVIEWKTRTLPTYILDKKGRLFHKSKTIFESGQSKVTYFEVLVTALSSVEIVAEAIGVETQA